ncbi:hypothetical protein TFV37 [Tiger frog virus]|uniref:Uncharacterized protein n=1 Tax=Rana tigrina ranavirus TaxID=160691 RepID=A0A8A4YKE5_RTRV|nr:hypothetical protein TFV37 [Tiger frog virus]
MTLPGVSGPLVPLSPGTNGTLWAVGPRVVRYQIPALAYLLPGALWTLRTCGTSLTSGPIGTRDSIPDPSRRPLRRRDPGATRAPRPHGDCLRVHVGSKQIVYIVRMQDAKIHVSFFLPGYTGTIPSRRESQESPGGPGGPLSPFGPMGPSLPMYPSGPFIPKMPTPPLFPCGPWSPLGPLVPTGPFRPLRPGVDDMVMACHWQMSMMVGYPSGPLGSRGLIMPLSPAPPLSPAGSVGPSGPMGKCHPPFPSYRRGRRDQEDPPLRPLPPHPWDRPLPWPLDPLGPVPPRGPASPLGP